MLVLPAVALLVSLLGFLVYTTTPAERTSRLHRVLDVRRTWPVLVPLAVAAGVIALLLFHDSAHCLMQNPIDSLTHFQRTWSCTTSGFLGGH